MLYSREGGARAIDYWFFFYLWLSAGLLMLVVLPFRLWFFSSVKKLLEFMI